MRDLNNGLGDTVSQALTVVGVTEERVSRWLGRSCRCRARREKLNRLGEWAVHVMTGKTERARQHLDDLLGEPPD